MKRLSALQRRILTVLAALGERAAGPVATRDIEHMLNRAADGQVYGNNLRASCRRMEAAGWLRTLRAPNLQLAVELTDAGRAAALPFLRAERDAEEKRRRETTVQVLASLPGSAAEKGISLRLGDLDYQATGAAFVVRMDGSACLQLELPGDVRKTLEGDALQVADWYQSCVRAGLPARIQVNPDAPRTPALPHT